MTWGLEGVTVDVDGRPGLIEVDVAVEAGQMVAVVGGDGAGKTTVVRTLVGLLSPARGRVRAPDPVGYQSSSSGVWPDMTVEENLSFVAGTFRLAPADRRRRVDVLLEATGLGPARERLGAALSGGMRQKLGVAMALLPEPELLVLDEPTTGVDPVSRTELWRLMTLAAARGAGVVFTSTYLEEAERAARVVALEQGRVLATGTVSEIARSVPGTVALTTGGGPTSWRRGRAWHTWYQGGDLPAGAHRIEPDLTDLLVAASIAMEATA